MSDNYAAKLVYEYVSASGESLKDCHILGIRFDERIGNHSDSREMYLLQSFGGELRCLQRSAWFTGLWRSPAGRVFVTDFNHGVLVGPDPSTPSAEWTREPLPGLLTGVWGLDENFVLVWGLGPPGVPNVMYRWDGARWNPMEAPGRVHAVRGVNPELIIATGDGRWISRWDGSKWIHLADARTNLQGLAVVSAEEIYACGWEGRVLQGSLSGWSEIVETTTAFPCIAKWRDTLFVGAYLEGLMALKERKLELVDRTLWPFSLEARDGLLVATQEAVAFSENGETFERISTASFKDLALNDPVHWTYEGKDDGEEQ